MAKNEALSEIYGRRVSSGMEYLNYLPADPLFIGDGGSMVDGTHPSDLCFLRMADMFTSP